MQKQLSSEVNIKYFNVPLNDDFPISYFPYTQKHRSVNQLHYHDAFEIGICTGGSGIFFIDNNVDAFQKDDVSFFFPNQPHIAQSPAETPSDWFFITADLISLFADNTALINDLLLHQHAIPNIITLQHDEDIYQLIKIVIHELDKKDQVNKLVIKNMLSSLILKLLRIKNRNTSKTELPSDNFRRISPVLTYISFHYADNLTVKMMASACNLSETYFRTVFKNTIGQTPLSYLASVRMKMAKTLLQSTKLPVITISQNVGYPSLSSFNRTFKERFSVSPTEYRKNHGNIC